MPVPTHLEYHRHQCLGYMLIQSVGATFVMEIVILHTNKGSSIATDYMANIVSELDLTINMTDFASTPWPDEVRESGKLHFEST